MDTITKKLGALDPIPSLHSDALYETILLQADTASLGTEVAYNLGVVPTMAFLVCPLEI